MSYEAVSWALYNAPMLLTEAGKPDTTARWVLAALAEKASADGTNSYPSVLLLHFMTGVDVKTIPRVLVRLEQGGLIEHVSTKPSGNKNWSLDMSKVRSETEWDDLVAVSEELKKVESAKRKERRAKAVSGDVSAGQDDESEPPETGSGVAEGAGGDDVRHFNHRRPAFKSPASGTLNADVRHAKRTEPYIEPPMNRPHPSTGGTLPPDPLRQPTPSGRVNESGTSIPEVVTDQPSLATQPTTRGNVVEFASRKNREQKARTAL